MNGSDLHDFMKHLDDYLAPRKPGSGGPSMATDIMNFPNLAKVRRVIGSDDEEINDLLTDKETRISRHMEEQQERHHQQWQEKLRYDKKRGKLTRFEQRIFDLLKQGSHWTMQDIIVKLGDRLAAKEITRIEAALHELGRRGLIVQTTNSINRQPEEPYVHNWFVVSKDERRIFCGLKPSKAYMAKVSKLPVKLVNTREMLDRSKMHRQSSKRIKE
jgi:hypothetical protein